MTNTEPKRPPILGTVVFAAVALCVAGFSILVGWQLYATAAKPITDFYTKLGELALQLAVVVIVGAFVKVLVDWGTSQRARYAEKIAARKEFMRRVRAMHVKIQNARDLMNAHKSPKTWSEQSRGLMELRPEVEEISEDLKASGNLFTNQITIVEGLEKIISYLQCAGDEYVRSHDAVDSGHKAGKSLVETIDKNDMTWVRDFMAGGESYKSNYEANLTKSKGAMRSEVYGS
jgi:hypothetical protein